MYEPLTLTAAFAVCTTPHCMNYGIAIDVLVELANPVVFCGPCATQIDPAAVMFPETAPTTDKELP